MTSPEDIINAFERGHSLLNRFRGIQQGKQGPSVDLIIDAELRLWQASYLLRRFREIEIEHRQKQREEIAAALAAGGQMHSARVSEDHARGDLLKLHGEAFYYFAWRTRQALRSVSGLRFDADGVRDVRNHLIEHPEGKDGFVVLNWMFGDPQGLVLAPWSGPGGQALDRGLYPNAREFIQKLLRNIERVLATEQ